MLFWLSLYAKTADYLSRQEARGLQSLFDIARTHDNMEAGEDKYGIFSFYIIYVKT